MSPAAAGAIASPATVLITGAAGGIGSALALEYAAPGRTLVLHARDAGRLRPLAESCEARGARALTLACDVADTAALAEALERLLQDTPVDLAIVNAGAASTRTGDDEPWPDIDRVIDVNVRGALATVNALVPHMLRRGHGQIGLVSSLAAYHGLPVSPAYSASKAALKAYGEAMRGWLGPRGVAVSVILPGFVRTAMHERFPAPRPFTLSAEDAARRIRRGLARNRARIAFPQPLAFAAWLLAVLPAAWSGRLARWAGY